MTTDMPMTAGRLASILAALPPDTPVSIKVKTVAAPVFTLDTSGGLAALSTNAYGVRCLTTPLILGSAQWQYRGTVTRVIDGDTAVVDVDLGFRHWHEMKFRFAGVDAYEKNDTDPARRALAMAGDARTRALMGPGEPVLIGSERDLTEKYGRYLGTFTNADGVVVNATLLSEGLGVPYGGGRR